MTDSSMMPATAYTWDAEGRPLAVTQGTTTLASYAYNALGQREQETISTYPTQPIQFQYDPGGGLVGMSQVTATTGWWYGVWSFFNLGGREVAAYTPAGGTLFPHPNTLGTTMQYSSQAGYQTGSTTDMLSYPWGQPWQGAGVYEFASLQLRDTSANLDWTPNRQYANRFGRWLSPDPAGRKAVTLTDPQTWNMYAYVRNNPTTLTDPDGLDYNVCTNDQNGNQTCNRVTDDVAFEQALKNPGAGITTEGDTQSGLIYGTGANGEQELVGSYQWVHPQEAIQDATVDLIVTADTARGLFALGRAGFEALSSMSGIQRLGLEGQPVIGKMADLEDLGAGERELALPDQLEPQANWVQNSRRLRQEMAEGRPIKDNTALKYGNNPNAQNSGFLRLERNVLRDRGWSYSNGYWYPPGR